MIDFIIPIDVANKADYSGEERRRYPRAQCDFALQYRNLNKNYSQATGALAKEISASGIKFISNSFLSVFTLLKVELLIESDIHSVSLTARVVWVQKLPYNENFMIGLEFLNIENETRAKIIRYVDEHSQRLSHSPSI